MSLWDIKEPQRPWHRKGFCQHTPVLKSWPPSTSEPDCLQKAAFAEKMWLRQGHQSGLIQYGICLRKQRLGGTHAHTCTHACTHTSSHAHMTMKKEEGCCLQAKDCPQTKQPYQHIIARCLVSRTQRKQCLLTQPIYEASLQQCWQTNTLDTCRTKVLRHHPLSPHPRTRCHLSSKENTIL